MIRQAALALAVAAGAFAQETLDLSDPVSVKVMELIKRKDPAALADFFETLDSAQRGKYLLPWLESLNRAQRWERLLEVCEASIPQLEAKSGPRLGIPRLLRAQALSQLQRHGEARLAHAENGAMGYPAGYENACTEARAEGDWPALALHAGELARTRPGLGLSLKGEALAKQLKFDEAEPMLLEAVRHEGHTAMAWADLACCQVERKAFAEALQSADRALALTPYHMEALYNRGRARFGLHQYREGREDLAAALATGQADPALSQNIRQNIAQADQYLAFQERQTLKHKND